MASNTSVFPPRDVAIKNIDITERLVDLIEYDVFELSNVVFGNIVKLNIIDSLSTKARANLLISNCLQCGYKSGLTKFHTAWPLE
jgi:hypothetical protein